MPRHTWSEAKAARQGSCHEGKGYCSQVGIVAAESNAAKQKKLFDNIRGIGVTRIG
ncbi:MAG TPA: hypothetical protein PKK68_05220 [Methanothrix soehngenii]|nr:hypothetical protein [Methanothrix soehngenii]